MNVRYTPPLMDQIRARRRPAGTRVVVVCAAGKWMRRVDPRTMRATGEVQQFLMQPGGAMTVLPRREWVEAPEEIVVGSLQI